VAEDGQVRLRVALPGDAAALSAAAGRLFHAAYRDTHTESDLAQHIGEHLTPAAFAADLADPATRVVLAEAGGTIAGYIQLHAYAAGEAPEIAGPGPTLEVKRLYVDARWHGQGVAVRLLEAAAARARELGAERLWLVVWERNERAKAFYRREGFRRVGSHPFRLGSRVYDDDLMVRAPSG
jgi:diamine N-acetyltransferase